MVMNHKNSFSEMRKIAIAESGSFKNFNGIVDAFGKRIGESIIKSIENVRFPVFKHGKTGIKFV